MEIERNFIVDNVDDIDKAAQWMREWIGVSGSNVVAFYGEMGSGKTTLISKICSIEGVEQTPSSPTFAIVNGYTTGEGRNIYHFDFYRIKKVEEAYDFGYQEYFYSGDLCMVEWPELVEELLPEDTLKVKIDVLSETKREITIL